MRYCELYQGTLDVYMENEGRKYHFMCKTVNSWYAAIETQQ